MVKNGWSSPLFGVSQIAGHIRGNDMGKKGMIREKGQAASNNGGAIGNEGGHAKELTGGLTQIGNPGIMKPTMIRGIVKPKKLPKIELNVAKILTILGKLRFPITIPKNNSENQAWQ